MRSLPRITLDHFRGGLRGFGFADVHQGRMSIAGFNRFGETGANCARVAFVPTFNGTKYTLDSKQIEDMLFTISELQKRKAYTVMLMALRDESEHHAVWTNSVVRQSLIDIGLEVVRATRNRTAVAGFDTFNEPARSPGGVGQDAVYWNEFVEPLVDQVRTIDSRRICITSTWPHGVCQTDPAYGEWARHVPGTVLTAHLYALFEFTHQGGLIDWVGEGVPYDPYGFTIEQAQHKALLWLRAHSMRTGQPVWIGEGSARQDRPGGTEWALHYTQLLEGFQMSGSWHFLLGAPVWQPNEQTMTVLKAWFARLKKR